MKKQHVPSNRTLNSQLAEPRPAGQQSVNVGPVRGEPGQASDDTTKKLPPGQQSQGRNEESESSSDRKLGAETRYPVEISKLLHYSAQTPIYSLLLAALSLSEHYERLPGADERQIKLEKLVKNYQQICAALNEVSF